MDWKQLIADLNAIGFRQADLCRLTWYSKAAMSDLANGITTDPGYCTGKKLVDLHKRYCKGKK